MYTDTDLEAQQNALETDIRYINDQISKINSQHNQPTIRWDRDIQKTTHKRRGALGQNRIKIQKFVYTHMPDGVHADATLTTTWFHVACTTIVADLKKKQHCLLFQ